MLQLAENLFSNLTCNPWEIDQAPFGEGADFADIRHRVVIEPTEIRRGAGWHTTGQWELDRIRSYCPVVESADCDC